MQQKIWNLIHRHQQWLGLISLLMVAALVIVGNLSFWRVAQAVGPYVVNSTADAGDWNPGDGDCAIDTALPATCTLRAALDEANATAYFDFPVSIHFNIPGAGPHTIQPGSPLPFITGGEVIIDGSTQPGADCNVWPPTLQIELDGTFAGGSGTSGLVFSVSPGTVRGLVINRFANENIGLYGSGGVTVQCNFLGTDITGTQPHSGSFDNLFVNGGVNNVIVGNVFGGSARGIMLAAASNNIVQGNYIGVNPAGTGTVGTLAGAVIVTGGSNQIGGTSPAARNVIAGSASYGIWLSSANAIGNVVQGNYIGVNAAGDAPLGHAYDGVRIDSGATNNTIGGATAGARNLISGNNGNGIYIKDSDTTGNVVQGNYIGTQANGTSALGNIESGILIEGVAGANTIGGVGAGQANVIAHNTSNGVTVLSSPGNAIRGNAIFANGGLGIDLGADGVTFNHQGAVAGPNNYQNYPVLTLATSLGESTRIQGFIESTPVTTFDFDVYANPTCDESAFGEGQTFLGTFQKTADDSGRINFDETIMTHVPEPQGVSVTATDSSNNTSEFSYCRPIAAPNLNWETARATQPVDSVSQYITDRYQEKWFKFPVTPGATVRVKLTGQAGSAVSLHRDPHLFYNQLTVPANAAVLSAQAADTGFLPFQSLPFQSLPFQSLPFQSLPFQSLPTGFLPFQSLPFQSLPFQSLPFQSLPFQSLPFQSLPTGSLPFQSLPFQSLPFQSLPSDSLPAGVENSAYSGAARRSLLSISLDPSATVQTIDINTYDLLEDLHVRVAGPNNLAAPFTLEVMVAGGVCETLQPVPTNLAVIAGQALPPGTFKTLILTHSGRLPGTTAEVQAALTKLQELANRTSDVGGVVIDLADPDYQRVTWANEQADANLACPTAKNIVAAEIKKVIDLYRAANENTLEYLVLAGGADVIPFFQVQDVAGLASEKEYVPPVKPSTASEAGLKVGLVQGQDGYGSRADLIFGSRTVAVPDLAVGRLVETANDIVTVVNGYLATNGVVIPNSALVTGYDFVGDAAAAIEIEAEAGINAAADLLIQAPGLPPSDASAWSAQDLRDQLFAGGHDFVVLSGHFSAGDLLAADYRTSIAASELASPTLDFTNVVVFTLGCHGGYTIPSNDLLTSASPDPDWAKVFLRKQVAGYVAATGYAYGDTELTEYGERLFVELTRQLRTGTGPIALGQALVAAKQQYLAQTAQLTGIDEKTLVEMTLYGLPMMKVNMPGLRLTPPTDSSIVNNAPAVTDGPGADLGLRVGQPGITPVLTEKNVPLLNRVDNSTVQTTYLTGKDGVVANPYEPIFPKELYNVTLNDAVLRGVALRSATYTDEPGVTPLTVAPATETSQAHPAFKTDKFYPNQVWTTNFFSAINGGSARLVAVPMQFKSTTPNATDGILRHYTDLNFNLYYLPENWTTTPASAVFKAAVAAAPTILSADAVVSGNTVSFTVQIQSEPEAGVQAVWVLYTGQSGPFYGQWQPLDLTRPDPTLDPTRWTGVLTLPGSASAEGLQFMVQAVNGAGATSLATNQGNYYTIAPATPPPPAQATSITLLSAPSNGAYLRDSAFTLRLTVAGQPLPNQVVTLLLGGQGVQTTTGSNGEATLTVQPILLPGEYAVQATFRGNASYLSSTATASFTVVKDNTSIALTPAAGTVTALLRDSAARPLGLRSIIFVVSGNNQTLVRSVIADYWGNAPLGALSLPPGIYTVNAYFNGVIPLGNNQTVTLVDDYYNPSQATETITINGNDTTPPVVTVSFPAPPVGQNGWFNALDAASGIVGTVTADETTTGGSHVTAITCSGAVIGTLTGQNTPQANATLTVTAEGSNVISCTATDSANNSGAAAGSNNTATVKLDKSAPDTTIVNKPTNPSNSTSATFTFTGSDSGGSDVAGFMCQLDSGAFTTCTSPQTYPTLTVGSHNFMVRAVDAAGNMDGAPATYTWTVQSNPNTLIGSCGGYDVYRTPRGKYVAAGWTGNIKVGTTGNNTLNGNNNRDLMLGLAGNDLLKGQGGDDILCGGDGVDLVQGFGGNDFLDGGNGNDVINGGTGDYDQLIGGEGNDALLDGDGVTTASGGNGNDLLTLALRNGWRDANGQPSFNGIAAGYGNDIVGLAILNSVRFFVDITGDERDIPPSPLEGTNDTLGLTGNIDPASIIIKFERRVALSADVKQLVPSEEAGAEYLSVAVGDESVDESQDNRLFLPFVVK